MPKVLSPNPTTLTWCLTKEFITCLLASYEWFDFLSTRTGFMSLRCLLRRCCSQGELSWDNTFCLAVEEGPYSQNLTTQYPSNFNLMLVLQKEGLQQRDQIVLFLSQQGFCVWLSESKLRKVHYNSFALSPWAEHKPSSVSKRGLHLLCMGSPPLPLLACMKSLTTSCYLAPTPKKKVTKNSK